MPARFAAWVSCESSAQPMPLPCQASAPELGREIARMQLDLRVPVDPLVQPSAAHHERRHHPAWAHGLATAVDHPRFGQLHDAVREHFGVHAQVVTTAQLAQNRVRDPSDPDLQRGAIRHQTGNEPTDLLRRGVRRGGLQLEQRGADQHQAVDLRDRHERAAQGVGHVRANLCDHEISGRDRRLNDVNGHAQAHIATFVWNADL